MHSKSKSNKIWYFKNSGQERSELTKTDQVTKVAKECRSLARNWPPFHIYHSQAFPENTQFCRRKRCGSAGWPPTNNFRKT